MSRCTQRAIIISSIILSVQLFSPLAMAANPVDTGQEEEFCSEDLALAGPGAFAGKPVSLLSGAETFSRTDLTVGNLYPIVIQRRYNSKSSYDSQLGYGWALNHDRRIYTYPDGSVTLRKDCGWKRRFTLSGETYSNPLGESGTLVKNADESFTYTQKDGSQEYYDNQGRLASLVDAKGNSLVFTYESATRSSLWGLLFSNLGTSPLIVSYDYRLSRIDEKDSFGSFTGKWVSFQYDFMTGRLISISDSSVPARIINYGHDGFGNLTSVTGPVVSATYLYEDPLNFHRMSGIDEGQGRYTNYYDAKGRVYQQIHGTGVIGIEYPEPRKSIVTTTVKDASGTELNTQVRTVEFDANGRISKETDALGNVNIYNRDGVMHLLREEHWENIGTIETPNLVLKAATEYTYDIYGNMKTKTEASDWAAIRKTTSYIYQYEINAAAPPSTFHSLYQEITPSAVNAASNKVTTHNYTYNSSDNTKVKTLTVVETGLLGDGSSYTYTTTYNYYDDGKLESIDGPRTDVQDLTTFYYAPVTGYLSGIEHPLAGTTTYTDYDSLGNPQTVTDPNGNATQYTYDEIGRVKTVMEPGNTAVTEYFYVSSGCSSCGSGGSNKIDYITLPLGNRIDYDYDAMGNLNKISDNAGNSINYMYDSEGNRLNEEIKDSSSVLRKSLGYEYDALNRLKRIINPDNTYTRYGYDYEGKRTSLKDPNTDPNQNTFTYKYDALSRLTDVIQPGGATTIYGYNSNNNLKSVKAANNTTTTYNYDDKGRVYQVISPDTGTTTYSYDPAGNMVSKTANGITISYQYDDLNRLKKIDFPSDTDVDYIYDTCLNGKGRLCTMTDASGSTTYEYTVKGQVKTETKNVTGASVNPYIIRYTYDQNSNLKTITYPSGRIITYSYATVNEQITDVVHKVDSTAANVTIASNIQYEPFGGVKSIKYGNNLTGTISYDNQYRVESISVGSVFDLSYSLYDSNGNIKTIENLLDSGKNRSFTYDALDRLDTASSSGIWGSLDWDYDDIGNRTREEVVGTGTNTYNYYAGTNKLQSITGLLSKSYTYDGNGNTDTEGSRDLVYNENQRLIRVVDGSTTKGEYTYNGNGQRVKKVTASGTTIFHYNLQGRIIAESDSAGNITAEYVYLNGQPLAKMEGTNTYYYHNDHLGTPQKMTDASGTIIWAADYKPFGEATVTVSTITNNLRGIGQYFDQETGLLYNYFRNLNTTTGRYNEADPIGIQKGRNHLYTYVKNRPLRLIDPYGLFGAGGTGTGPFGHGDFPGSDYFDYNREDRGETSPYNDPERHFRDLAQSEADVARAIAFCDREGFERAMHRGQDYFSHYRNGYRYDPFSWNRCLGFGHLCPLINPTGADTNVDDWIDAARWTQDRLDSWRRMCGCR